MITYDSATLDSTGAFLVGELERLDQTLHMPLVQYTWSRDIDLRTDIQMGDDISSFTNSSFSAVGSLSATGKSWAGKNSNAIPGVTVDISKTPNPLHLWARSVSYTIPELASAMQLGRPIDAQKLLGLQLIYQMEMDQMTYVGDAEVGATGLCNHAGVDTANVADDGTGSSRLWSTKEPTQILRDIRDAEVAAWAASAYSVAPTHLRLPPLQSAALLQPMSINGVAYASIGEYIGRNSLCMQENGVPLDIKSVKHLAGAGGSATNRFILYSKQPQYVRLPLVSLQRTPLEFRGIEQMTTYFGKVGAVEVVYPETLVYRDGI